MSDTNNPLEDWRGVDIGQIRSQLRMSVDERVRVMVHAANVMMSIREHAQAARTRTTSCASPVDLSPT